MLKGEEGLVGLGKIDVDMYHCAYHYKYCGFTYVLCTIVVTHHDTSLTRTNQCNEVALKPPNQSVYPTQPVHSAPWTARNYAKS